MMTKLLLVFDQLEWATGSEAVALRKQLDLYAPGKFEVTLHESRYGSKATTGEFDMLLSGLYYHLIDSVHPKSISMVSSESYWLRKVWTAEQNKETGVAGWPHLNQWKYMVAHNKELYDRLIPEDHPDVRLLYHVFDQDFWCPASTAPSKKFKVGFAGHEQHVKGWDIFQAAAKELPDVEFAAATYETVRKPAAEMPDFYRSLDAYLCPGRWDCGPRPPIEAGLCGTAVITTRIGQIGEMVTDEETCLLIEPTVDSVCAAIERLRTDVSLKQRLGINARVAFTEWAISTGKAWTEYLLGIAAD